MLSITNQASLQAALTAVQNAWVRERLLAYAPQFSDPQLKDQTHLIVVTHDTSEDEVASELGHSPLLNPSTGVRYRERDFSEYWDSLTEWHGGFDMIIRIGDSGFAFILLVEGGESYIPDLRAMCGDFADESTGSRSGAGAGR